MVMPSTPLILCCSLSLLLSVFCKHAHIHTQTHRDGNSFQKLDVGFRGLCVRVYAQLLQSCLILCDPQAAPIGLL